MANPKTNKQVVEAYIAGVLDGSIVASEMVRAACQRHLDDLEHGEARGLCFDEEIAEGMCNIFPILTHTIGDYSGKPFELDPFQAFIVWCVFGWRRAADGLRRFGEVYISMARGNGKSAFAAALLLIVFALDHPIEVKAECYTVATKEDQAAIVFNDAKAFVDKEPELQGYIARLKKNLSIPRLGSFCRPIGSDSQNTDGLRPHCVVADELHAWRKQHRELWDKLITAFTKRRQPLLIVITTAGTEASLLWIEIDETARAVVDRTNAIEDDALFAFIAEVDEEDDPLDEKNWPKANPMLASGVVQIEPLRRMAEKARTKPEVRNTFTRYHANRKVSSGERLISSKRWAKGAGPLPPLNGLTGHSGFDWGFKDDLTALAHVFPLDSVEIDGKPKRRYAIELDCWAPKESPHDWRREPWAGFVDRGELELTEGSSTDVWAVYERLAERGERHAIRTIAMDPNQCREFGQRVTNEYGFEAFWFGQTCGKYNEPMLELLAALDEGRIDHGGNTLLAWCVQHMVTRKDHRGYRMPDKEKSTQKIDPVVATLMALSECMFFDGEDEFEYEPGSMFL
ncbi:MAG: terminase TerL endonuclease subunit [Planctomycetota bacterium]